MKAVNKIKMYNDLSDIFYDELIVDNPYISAEQLHMGSCDVFSYALNQKFGYEIWRIDCDNSFHMYCKTEYNGKTVYIDASGMSYRLTDILPSIISNSKNLDVDREYKVDNVYLDGEYDLIGLDFAYRYIDSYWERFNIMRV